ncbi:MAG: DUF1456 family protein [Vicingaceae bacterium]
MALSNNDIIKKLRVALKLRDDDIVKILKLVDYDISKTELSAFFRNEEHPHYRQLKDQILRNFLNGLVIYKRGPRDKKPKEKIEKKQQPFADPGPNFKSQSKDADQADTKKIAGLRVRKKK